MPFVHPVNGKTYSNVDLFAGGGMVSEAFREAYGVDPDVAINHDEDAIGMHRANHPTTTHYRESVFKTDPAVVMEGRPRIWHLHASPDCVFFSRSRGCKPVTRNRRALADVVIHWLERLKEGPELITIENVPEFQKNGPTIQGRIYDNGKRVPLKLLLEADNDNEPEFYKHGKPEFDKQGAPLQYPDPRYTGKYFRAWVRKIKKHGYKTFHGLINHSDYGDATTRVRFYFVAVRKEGPLGHITKRTHWPLITHGNPDTEAVKSGKLLPWKTAADIIDFDTKAPSIFMTKMQTLLWNRETNQSCKRPLVVNTRARIARGLMRFVFNSKQPFIVKLNHSSPGFRGQGSDQPLQTLTCSREYAVATPHLEPMDGKGASTQLVAKNTLQVAKQEALSSTAMFLARHNTGMDARDALEPMPTLTTAGSQVQPVTIHMMQENYAGRSRDAREPMPAMTCRNTQHKIMSTHLTRHHTRSTGSEITQPLPTIETNDTNAITSHYLVKQYGSCKDGVPVTQPAPTFTAGGNHLSRVENTLLPLDGEAGLHNRVAEVRAFLMEFFGPGGMYEGQLTDEQMLGITEIDGEKYQVTDIGMRMLSPREGFRAHSAREDYIIDRTADGKKLSVSKQMEKCGNSVPIRGVTALFRSVNEAQNWDEMPMAA